MLATASTSHDSVGNTVAFLVIDLPALAYMAQRQVRKRKLNHRLGLPLVLAALGLAYFGVYSAAHPVSGLDLQLIGLSIAVLSIGVGVARAYTVKIWTEHGVAYRRGTWITFAMWAIAVGIHLSLDVFTRAVAASLLFYLAVTWIVQVLVVWHRWQRMLARQVPPCRAESE